MSKTFDLDDLERFIMDTIDINFSSHPDRDGVKSIIASRFMIYRNQQSARCP